MVLVTKRIVTHHENSVEQCQGDTRCVDAIHTITAASTSGTDQTDADAAAATVDKHLRELKLILIGSLTLTVHHLYLFLL